MKNSLINNTYDTYMYNIQKEGSYEFTYRRMSHFIWEVLADDDFSHLFYAEIEPADYTFNFPQQ